MTHKTQPTAHAEITAPISADLRRIEQAHKCIRPQCDPAKCMGCVCAIGPSDESGQVVLSLLNVFAVNDLGHPFEDGDSAAVDRARQWLQNRSAAQQAAPPAPAAVAVPAASEVLDALNYVDDFVARCNGDDRGSCASVNLLRAALAAAPAQEHTGETLANTRGHPHGD